MTACGLKLGSWAAREPQAEIGIIVLGAIFFGYAEVPNSLKFKVKKFRWVLYC